MNNSSERGRAFRARRRAEGKPYRDKGKHRDYKRTWKRGRCLAVKPFVGCDGEGCGVDDKGRQLYTLFRMGGRELFEGGRHLRTAEILDFICDEPRENLLVGFAFGYDVTMILRDLPPGQQKKLFAAKVFEKGFSPFVWYKDFDIDYLPKQYFRVRRVKIERALDGSEKRVVIPGSTRTIYETFGFFQKSFVKVIGEFGVGTSEQRESVALDKARRSDFVSITQRERDYCALECSMLAELMEKLREYCDAAGIRPRSWNGAGKLASALHSLHDTPRSANVKAIVPAPVLDFANMAYYGGRFEITRTGLIGETIHEYDIRSAYPDAMRFLPCLEHGSWEEVDGKQLARLAGNGDGRTGQHHLFVAAVSFKTPFQERGMAQLGGLPVRSKEGHLYWPRQGAGVYWSCEIASAEKLGAKISYKSGWKYNRQCDCEPFNWVEKLFEYRRSIGSSGPGYPIKLGINSLYGKLAQRKGNGAYCNMVWAGLITALTRSKLNAAIAQNPQRIVMVATDAVYSLDPLPGLDCGERLGQWEGAVLDGLFIVQPGLYWCPAKRKRKSRGLSGKFFEEPGLTESFEEGWADYASTAPLAPKDKKAVQFLASDFIKWRGGIQLFNSHGDVSPEAADIVDRFKDLIPDKPRRKAMALRDRKNKTRALAKLLSGKAGGLFAKEGGLSPDYMREALTEDGWFQNTQSQGADIEDLHELLDNIRRNNTDAIIHPSEEFAPKEQDFPTVSVPVPGFIGLKLAIARNKPDLAGTWVKDQRTISFDYRNKRQGHEWQGGHIVTAIKAGYPGLVSLPHRDFLAAGGQEPWENARAMLDEQPDFVDLGIPFKD